MKLYKELLRLKNYFVMEQVFDLEVNFEGA